MPCDDLDSGLTRSNRPAGGLGRSARPAGALTESAHPASGDFCRSYNFAPIPSGFLVLFDTTSMNDFAGNPLVSF